MPLIRLAFNFYDERQQFNAIRVGQQYNGKVANPEDMILLKCVKKRTKKSIYSDEADDVQRENLVSEVNFH